MLTLAHGHHGAALPPTRWLLPLHPSIQLQPVAQRAEEAPALVQMRTEVGGLFALQHHLGCEWRGEFAMGMPEAAC